MTMNTEQIGISPSNQELYEDERKATERLIIQLSLLEPFYWIPIEIMGVSVIPSEKFAMMSPREINAEAAWQLSLCTWTQLPCILVLSPVYVLPNDEYPTGGWQMTWRGIYRRMQQYEDQEGGADIFVELLGDVEGGSQPILFYPGGPEAWTARMFEVEDNTPHSDDLLNFLNRSEPHTRILERGMRWYSDLLRQPHDFKSASWLNQIAEEIERSNPPSRESWVAPIDYASDMAALLHDGIRGDLRNQPLPWHLDIAASGIVAPRLASFLYSRPVTERSDWTTFSVVLENPRQKPVHEIGAALQADCREVQPDGLGFVAVSETQPVEIGGTPQFVAKVRISGLFRGTGLVEFIVQKCQFMLADVSSPQVSKQPISLFKGGMIGWAKGLTHGFMPLKPIFPQHEEAAEENDGSDFQAHSADAESCVVCGGICRQDEGADDLSIHPLETLVVSSFVAIGVKWEDDAFSAVERDPS